MSRASNRRTTSIFQVVADMQESMEDSGLSTDLVDVIVTRGLEILLGTLDESAQTALA